MRGRTKAATILVVNDEPRIRRAMRGVLSVQGYDILEASDGEQAMKVFWSKSPDLVLLDVNVPVIDGFEVCRQIRCASRVPIIILTMRSSESDKVRALDSGAGDYVVMPCGIEEILARIRSALRRSSKDANRAMVWTKTQSGRVVTCSDCSWWAPVYGQDIYWVGEEFDFHACGDYPPLRFAVEDLDKTG